MTLCMPGSAQPRNQPPVTIEVETCEQLAGELPRTSPGFLSEALAFSDSGSSPQREIWSLAGRNIWGLTSSRRPAAAQRSTCQEAAGQLLELGARHAASSRT